MPERSTRAAANALRLSCLGVMAFAIALCGQTLRAQAEELIKFESAPYVLGQVQQRQAIERGETVAKLPTTIDGYLSKPIELQSCRRSCARCSATSARPGRPVPRSRRTA